MVDRHDIDEFSGHALGVLLLDKLGEDTLEIGERKRVFELGRGCVGEDLSFRYDDDTVTDQLDYLKHVGDVEDCFALRG